MFSLSTLWFAYKIVWVLSFILIFFRKDFYVIKSEFLRSMNTNLSKCVTNLVIMLLVLPITLPFTLANIFNKWL